MSDSKQTDQAADKLIRGQKRAAKGFEAVVRCRPHGPRGDPLGRMNPRLTKIVEHASGRRAPRPEDDPEDLLVRIQRQTWERWVARVCHPNSPAAVGEKCLLAGRAGAEKRRGNYKADPELCRRRLEQYRRDNPKVSPTASANRVGKMFKPPVSGKTVGRLAAKAAREDFGTAPRRVPPAF